MTTSEPTPIRLLIVDDHPVVRRGLAYSLLAFDDVEVVGEASSGEEAVRLCEQLMPDVILMDIIMPGMNGVVATRVLRERHPNVRILALTSFLEHDLIQGILNAGAQGYLLKDVTIEELARAIRATHAGQSILAGAVARTLVEEPDHARDGLEQLTARQREVVALVAAGLSNQQIARRLNISHATARSHVSLILEKLGASNRAEAAAVAVRLHLFTAVPAD